MCNEGLPYPGNSQDTPNHISNCGNFPSVLNKMLYWTMVLTLECCKYANKVAILMMKEVSKVS